MRRALKESEKETTFFAERVSSIAKGGRKKRKSKQENFPHAKITGPLKWGKDDPRNPPLRDPTSQK